MTDNEIIKALECCIDGDCQDCMYGETSQRTCKDDLMRESLDLINRQKAEIERLRELVKIDNDYIEEIKQAFNVRVEKCQNSKAEAIKEFAERLKSERFETEVDAYSVAYILGADEIDDLVEEMMEE